MFVICYLFVVYALICYIKQKKGDCLFWLFASSTGLGFIDTSTAPVKTSDFLIVASIIILVSEYAKNPTFFRLKGEKVTQYNARMRNFTQEQWNMIKDEYEYLTKEGLTASEAKDWISQYVFGSE